MHRWCISLEQCWRCRERRTRTVVVDFPDTSRVWRCGWRCYEEVRSPDPKRTNSTLPAIGIGWWSGTTRHAVSWNNNDIGALLRRDAWSCPLTVREPNVHRWNSLRIINVNLPVITHVRWICERLVTSGAAVDSGVGGWIVGYTAMANFVFPSPDDEWTLTAQFER